MTGTLVAIDGDAFSFPTYTAAAIDAQRWNGWASPWFERAEVVRLIAESEYAPGVPVFRWEHDGEALPAVVMLAGPDDDPEDGPIRDTYRPRMLGGVPVWALGAWCWCWCEVDPDGTGA